MAGIIGKTPHGTTLVNLDAVAAAVFDGPRGGRKEQLEIQLVSGEKVYYADIEALENWRVLKEHFDVRDDI
jgi:hypothetical protein